MLPFQLAIYVVNEMLDVIRMHSVLMIEDYVYIYGFLIAFIENYWFLIYY